MESQSRRFLIVFSVAVLAIATGLGLCNLIVDPYALFKPSIGTNISGNDAVTMSTEDERLTKSFDVFRGAPSGLILGSSAVDLGLDALNPAWPKEAKPLYNLGMFSIDTSGVYQYLQRVLRLRHINFVVIGVDSDEFLGRWVRQLSEQELSRLKESYPHVQTNDLLSATLSFDALAASTDAIVGRAIGIHSEYVSGNHPVDAAERLARRVGPTAHFRVTDLRNISVAAVKPSASNQISALQNILELCLSNRIRVIVFINPIHAHQLEVYSKLGYWQSFENWKRALVAMMAPFQLSGNRSESVELWDFSGYDQYSTTELPQATTWFWDSAHYTHQLGDLIIRRLFLGKGDPEFGVRLSPETIEARLTAVRMRQLQYRQTHREAERELQRLYAETPH